MKQYKVEYTPAAKADLKSIYTYIAFQLKERTTARNIVNRIRKQIRELDTSPERYVAVDWKPWSEMGMRKVPVGNYVVFYYVIHDTDTVMINRIFYGGRNIEGIVKESE